MSEPIIVERIRRPKRPRPPWTRSTRLEAERIYARRSLEGRYRQAVIAVERIDALAEAELDEDSKLLTALVLARLTLEELREAER